LRRNAQRAVELAGRVLPGDDLGQLDDRIVVENGTNLREQRVVDVAVGERDRVGVAQR
jgi:hypothetical protein